MNATSRVGATIRRNPFCRTVHVRALHQARRDPPAVLVPSGGSACACDMVLRNGDSARSPQWNRFQLERLAGMDRGGQLLVERGGRLRPGAVSKLRAVVLAVRQCERRPFRSRGERSRDAPQRTPRGPNRDVARLWLSVAVAVAAGGVRREEWRRSASFGDMHTHSGSAHQRLAGRHPRGMAVHNRRRARSCDGDRSHCCSEWAYEHRTSWLWR